MRPEVCYFAVFYLITLIVGRLKRGNKVVGVRAYADCLQ